ncbi:hypothetical protein ACGFX4_37650 [Kitasatospora sp. NPDC048365]|uniref:hypothetical protein n=1 Tax=Kitasatospora sp. NPDC048365 TaxID=3364050 RepID=UPI003717F6AA
MSTWSDLTDLPDRPGPAVTEAWLTGLGFNRAAPAEVLIALLDAGHAGFLHRTDLPDGVLDAAAVHPLRAVWGRAAESGRLSAAQWERLLAVRAGSALRELLAEMAAEQLAARASGGGVGVARRPHPDDRPPATAAEIAAWADEVPEIPVEDRTYALWWVAALHDDPVAMRQLASSPKLWIRRSVARAPHLPPDVAALLARDPDRAVRLFLSESCEDAPPELLLDVWSWWPGSLSFPGRPRNHPGFPRAGLLRFADDPRPRMRVLALDDPASTPALVERFAGDPDPGVRSRAAEDLRLTPASAVRLTADGSATVRAFAGRNPVLPQAELARLLRDAEAAADAARNPALPVAVMRRMVALAALHNSHRDGHRTTR